jgi:hypothetical protein
MNREFDKFLIGKCYLKKNSKHFVEKDYKIKVELE